MVNVGRDMVGKCYALVGALCLLLTGCGNQSGGPVTWWHNYEGGAIAQNRPPPPGANAPYPNYAQLPKKPVILPQTTRQAQMASLAENRNLTLAAAAAAPLPVTAMTPITKPKAAAPVTMTSEAATAKPAAAVAPIATQAAAVDESAPIPAGAAPPDLAAAPPAPAVLPNLGNALGAPTVASNDFDHLTVGFDPGTVAVPREAMPGLIGFAQAHQRKIIRIAGYGDGRNDAALAQGWQRAQAVAAALVAAGVPVKNLRLAAGQNPGGQNDAAAVGRGAELSLLN